jgi:SOS-response transcriptional repressor LexA
MDIGQIIRKARKAKKLSLEDLAHQVNYDSGNLSRLERGIQNTNPEMLKLLMDALGIKLSAEAQREGQKVGDVSNVFDAQQPFREPRKYPLVSWVEAGEMTESPNKIGEVYKWLETTEAAGDGAYWLTVSGHSMTSTGNPNFPEGSLILVKPDAEIINGKYYVVEMLDSGEKTFKQYVEDAGFRYLRPLNDKYRTIEIDNNCRFLGRIVDTKMTGL